MSELKECFLADIDRLKDVIKNEESAEKIMDELAKFAEDLRNYTLDICVQIVKGER